MNSALAFLIGYPSVALLLPAATFRHHYVFYLLCAVPCVAAICWIDYARKNRSPLDIVQSLPARRDQWSDWGGALFTSGSAAYLFRHTTAQFSILLFPTVGHEVLVAISFLIRRKPKGRPAAWYVRGTSYIASYGFLIFMIAAETWQPQWLANTRNAQLNVLGAFLWLFGSFFGLWAVWFLRRSFSIEPQARELIARGPYTIARHPIYLSYILQYGSILVIHPTFAFGLMYCVWFVMMFIRARFEEQVLQASFPSYQSYRHQVGMFWPKLMAMRQLMHREEHSYRFTSRGRRVGSD
jgi:protein-S-isoprenylcysteine O-methyltransferase Ste14